MATVYQIINVKESKGTMEGNPFDNRMILCFSSDTSKYLVCGAYTENLKMRTDDFNYVIRNHEYALGELEGKIISPTFDKNGYVTDFTLSDPESGEVT